MASETYRMNDVEVVRSTDRAILVTGPCLDDEVWVPKSQIDSDSEVWDDSPDGSGPGTLIVSFWFAEKQGWA